MRLFEHPDFEQAIIRAAEHFYDDVTQDDHEVVNIKAVGHKVHNTLFIGGTEVHL